MRHLQSVWQYTNSMASLNSVQNPRYSTVLMGADRVEALMVACESMLILFSLYRHVLLRVLLSGALPGSASHCNCAG